MAIRKVGQQRHTEPAVLKALAPGINHKFWVEPSGGPGGYEISKEKIMGYGWNADEKVWGNAVTPIEAHDFR